MRLRDGKATAVLPTCILSSQGSSRLACRLNNNSVAVALVLLTAHAKSNQYMSSGALGTRVKVYMMLFILDISSHFVPVKKKRLPF